MCRPRARGEAAAAAAAVRWASLARVSAQSLMSPLSAKRLVARQKAAEAAGALWSKPGRSAKQKRATKQKVAATVGAADAALANAHRRSALRKLCSQSAVSGELLMGLGGRRQCLAFLSLEDCTPFYLVAQRWQYKNEVWVLPPFCDEMKAWYAPKSAQDDPLGRKLFAHEYTPRASVSKRKRAPHFVCCMCLCKGARELERLSSCCETCARPMESAMLAQREFGSRKHEKAIAANTMFVEVPEDICGALAIWLSFRANAEAGPGRWRLPELRRRVADVWALCQWCGRFHTTANIACTECEDLHKWARLALADDVRAMLKRWEGGKEELVPGSRRLLAHFSELRA